MNIPNSISIFRFLMVPILLVLAWTGHARVFLILLVISFLSDVNEEGRVFHGGQALSINDALRSVSQWAVDTQIV